MGLFQKWIYGVDLDEEQARQNELDAALARENKRDLDAGVWDQATFDRAEANRIGSRIEDVHGQVNAAFREGLNDGVDNVRGAIGSTISFPFRLIPWQLWLIGVGALLVYMGGWARLAGMLNKR